MPPGQQPQQNPYDFIMNPAQPAKKPGFSYGGGNKLMLLAGGGIVLIIVLFLLTTLLGGNKDSTQQLIEITQEQQEIVRVAGLSKQARGQNVLVFATNTTAIVTSSQQQVTALLPKKSQPNAKTLALKKDASTDKKLKAAEQTNEFDTVFTATLLQQLAAYQKNLKSAYDDASDKKTKAVLNTAYKNATSLVKSQSSGATQEPN